MKLIVKSVQILSICLYYLQISIPDIAFPTDQQFNFNIDFKEVLCFKFNLIKLFSKYQNPVLIIMVHFKK